MVDSEEDNGSNKYIDKKRRFSEEQVKLMELMFQNQTKLEPRKKLELASELGLHPRQVSIWFQNKRARWKSKQLEKEYDALKEDYDALLLKYESVENEKQILSKQLKKLVELMDTKLMKEKGKDRQNLEMTLNDYEKEGNLFNTSHIVGNVNEQEFGFHQLNWPSSQLGENSQWWEFSPPNQ